MTEQVPPVPVPRAPLTEPRTAAVSVAHPLWQAASFSVLLYVGWMLLGGLFHPRLAWFSGSAFDVRPLLLYLCLDGFALALSMAYHRGLDGRSYRTLGLWFNPGWLRQAAAGAAWGAGAVSVTAALLTGAGAAALPPGRSVSVHDLSLVAFLLLAATFEELAFRGYAFGRAQEVVGPVATALLSSALFGFAHYGNPQATLLSTCNTVLAGLLLAAARVRSRALWMPIGLHFSWNLFLGPVFAFPVSGYTFGMTAVSSAAAGSAWLSGGDYGPEGGAALTAVLLVGIALLSRLPVPVASLEANSGVD